MVTVALRPAPARPTTFGELRSQRRHARVRGRIDALGVGLLAALIGLIGAGVPSYWFDEAATVASANRPLPDLFRLLGNIDAVHGAYYLLMHGWIAVFGASEWSTRIPSVLGVGLAAAGTVVLGTRLRSRRVGVTAGIVLAVLPRMTWAATEARSYALVAALAVWTVVALLAALRRGGFGRWALYGACVTASVLLFLHLATLVVALAAAVALVPAWRRRLVPMLAASAAGAVVTVPFVLLTLHERVQIDWIPRLGPEVALTVWRDQLFPGATGTAVLATLLLLAGLACWRGRRPEPAVVLGLAWLLVPPALLIGYSLVKRPIYLDRYAIFTAPALALLVAVAVTALGGRLLAGILVAVLAASAVPAYVAQRQPDAKPSEMDYSLVANALEARARPGDCVAFESTVSWNPASMRTVQGARPDAFAGLRDIGRGRTAEQRVDFWPENLPVADIGRAAATCSTVWVLTDAERTDGRMIRHSTGEEWDLPVHRFTDDPLHAALTADGLRVTNRTPFLVSQLIEMRR